VTSLSSVFQRNSWIYKLASIIVSLAFLTLATLAIHSTLTTYLLKPPAKPICRKLDTRSRGESLNSQPLENIMMLPVIFL